MTEPARRSYAGGRFAPGCRIVTHNIRGWTGSFVAEGSPSPPSVPQLANFHKTFKLYHNWWCALKADIVFVQECLISRANGEARNHVEGRMAAAAREFGGPGYRILWGCNSEGPSGGTATLIRSDWLRDGQLQIVNGETRGVAAADDGRLLYLRCRWAGHSLLLVNSYLPSSNPAAQRTFLKERLGPLLERHRGDGVIAGGDFNFTMDWRLDRWPPRDNPSHYDENPARVMAELSTRLSLRDVLRYLSPTKRCYTFFSGSAASLLDRFFLSDALLPFAAQCRVEVGPAASDHQPVVLHLRPRTPAAVGRGQPHTRMVFSVDPDLQRELEEWIGREVERAPTADDHALLVWWPAFKARALAACRGLDRRYREATAQLSAQQEAARAAFEAAMERVERGDLVGEQQPNNLAELIEARRQYSTAMAVRSREEEKKWRGLQLREGERPSPLLTAILNPPSAAGQIAGLATPGGGICTSGPEMASIMARNFAAVSAAPTTDPAAERRVLDAVAEHATPLDEAAAAAAGAPTISRREVQKAVTAAASGGSPGPDGLPPEFWKRGGEPLACLLAALFSAIGRTGDTPRGFLDGVVSPIYKAGDVTQATNYRPITLLNSDYRCLTRVLATRVGELLGPALGPEQTAFLEGRLISDNVSFLHLLPEVLRSNARFRSGPVAGVLAFLDFRKAYDTISRPFLLGVMAKFGAGDGLCKWVATILSGTFASARVNGFVSEAYEYEAGVRQGCPLAPLLYLFAAWALLCFLKTCPALGAEGAPGRRAYAVQFADDIAPFLRSASLAHRQVFSEDMDAFGRASGQCLNALKSKLLRIGREEEEGTGEEGGGVGGGAPAAAGAIPFATSASGLGAVFTNDAANLDGSLVDWEGLLGGVTKCYQRVASLPMLSIFGRAAAAGSYGVGKILYQAQHNGLPEPVATTLEKLTKGLVDRGDAPPFRAGNRPGIAYRLLVGRPANGGFGLFPWKEHLLARHATTSRRYLIHLLKGNEATEPLWVPLVTTLLTRLFPPVHPAFALLSYGRNSVPRLPLGPLRRMGDGIAALGEVEEIAEAPMPVGPWCAHLPLWGNPLLQLERPATGANRRTVRWEGSSEAAVLAAQQPGFDEWMVLPGLHTLGDLAFLLRTLEREAATLRLTPALVPHRRRLAALFEALYGPDPPPPPLPRRHRLDLLFQRWSPQEEHVEILSAARGMFLAIPQVLRSALPTGPHSHPGRLGRTRGPVDLVATAEAVSVVLGRLGWPGAALMDRRVKGANGRLFYPLTVKSATNLQLGDCFAAQREARADYVDSALSVGGGGSGEPALDPAAALEGLEAGLRALWRVPWDNVHKEPLWRLSVNGVRNAGGHELCPSHPCPCGFHGLPGNPSLRQNSFSWRLHHFWHCPVATAVVAEIRRALPGSTVTCAHVWLLRPPSGVAHSGVWGVVAAAALAAMLSGRKNFIRLHLQRREAVGRGQTILDDYYPHVAGAPEPTTIERATRWAAAWFWTLLTDFASSNNNLPPDWGAGPPADHPFLAVDAARRIIVRPA